jgi:hypothetical protein
MVGFHVPSDLLLIEDAQSMQINNSLVNWQHAALKKLAFITHTKSKGLNTM